MAMAKKITISDVSKMLPSLRKGIEKFGKQYSPAYTQAQLVEALLVVADQLREQPIFTKEDYNKLARQLAACTSREKGLRNRIAGVKNEDDAAELKADVSELDAREAIQRVENSSQTGS